jgi:hypothetical protein
MSHGSHRISNKSAPSAKTVEVEFTSATTTLLTIRQGIVPAGADFSGMGCRPQDGFVHGARRTSQKKWPAEAGPRQEEIGTGKKAELRYQASVTCSTSV